MASDAADRSESSTPPTRPAAENPWYVLATIHGEQIGDKPDVRLHAENRRIWNGWSCGHLSDEKRSELALLAALEPEELLPLTEQELSLVHDIFERKNIKLPDHNQLTIFGGTHYSEKLIMDSFIFNNYTCFSGAIFSKSSSFSFSIFTQQALFQHTRFKDISNFNNTTFFKQAMFNEAIFCNSVSFSSSTFENGVTFDLVKFSRVLFMSTKFKENVWFGSVKVKDESWFSGATFIKDAVFTESKFDEVLRISATFNGNVKFDSVICKSGAEFDSSIFNSNVNFESSEFKYKISFDSVLFKGITKFNDTKFSSVRFNYSIFENFTYFTSALFQSFADFSACYFERPVDFTEAKFVSSFPILSGTILQQNITFTANKDYWPQFAKAPPEESRESLAAIRHATGKQGRLEAEHFFYRREMEFASQIGTLLERLFYRAFGILSDYGDSISRPVCALLIVLFIGLVPYTYWLTWCAPTLAEAHPIFTAFGFSFSQLFGFLGFSRLYFNADFLASLPTVLKVVAALQTFFGVVLIFLLGLGLRTRFRLR